MNRMTAEEPTPSELIDDDDELELVAVAPEQPLRVGALVSVRFDPDSTRLLQQVASNEGVTQAEFVRRAALQAARKTVRRAS